MTAPLRSLASRAPHPVRHLAREGLVRYRHLGLHGSDVVMASYPKSGSTWLRFVLVTALTDEDVDFDSVRRLSPPLGRQRGGPTIVPGGGRLVKSHELPHFPPGRPVPKVLHLVRDVRDVAVSYYHHARRDGTAPATLDEFLEGFLAGRAGPYGHWHRHSLAWRDHVQRHPEGAVSIRYEDLRATPVDVLMTASDRLGLGLDRARAEAAFAANQPASMRAKESSSAWLAKNSSDRSVSFVREGRTGNWRESFDDITLARVRALSGRALAAFGYPLD